MHCTCPPVCSILPVAHFDLTHLKEWQEMPLIVNKQNTHKACFFILISFQLTSLISLLFPLLSSGATLISCCSDLMPVCGRWKIQFYNFTMNTQSSRFIKHWDGLLGPIKFLIHGLFSINLYKLVHEAHFTTVVKRTKLSIMQTT
jgi:hypothetical protein